ncbi:IS6 family transposase [Sulfolobus sp. A20-N-F8]|nr:IS6 family transposase [Sulfolobus sp. A20-N-F8]
MNIFDFLALTQIISTLLKYINVKPRFHSLDEIVLSLTSYLLGLSSWRTSLPHTTLLYYFHKLANVNYEVKVDVKRGDYLLVDETKVLRVNGEYYYLWVVRHCESGLVVFFMLTSLRSGFHVYVILNGIKLENWRDKVIFLHDKASVYKAFSWFNAKHEVETFGKRSLVELVFRSLKHRLASMDSHFTWNSTRNTITRWLKIFFNTIYSKSISISWNKIEFYGGG